MSIVESVWEDCYATTPGMQHDLSIWTPRDEVQRACQNETARYLDNQSVRLRALIGGDYS
jgi:hypothetical protein